MIAGEEYLALLSSYLGKHIPRKGDSYVAVRATKNSEFPFPIFLPRDLAVAGFGLDTIYGKGRKYEEFQPVDLKRTPRPGIEPGPST